MEKKGIISISDNPSIPMKVLYAFIKHQKTGVHVIQTLEANN
jgi:hypothetical protein